MSLRDLKNLAPWQWESKVAQKKHAIGPKGLQDFEQVARVLQSDGKSQLAEKQVTCSKRRRATKESEDLAAVPSKEADQHTADTADLSLAAATPAVPVKKQRPSASATPAVPRTANNFASSSGSHQKPPSRSDPTSRSSKLLSTPPGVTTPGFGLSLCPAAYTPGPLAAALNTAGTVETAVEAAAAAARGEIRHDADAGRAYSGRGGARACEKADLRTGKQQQQLVAPASKVQPTPSCGHTPAAAAAATPTAAGLLADVFSPSPCLPTPTPYAALRFKCTATPAATTGSEGGSAVKAVGWVGGTSSAPKPQGEHNSSGGMRRPAAAGTPLPRPQFTTPRMPPPASRRHNLQQRQQQTPLGAAAAGGSGGGSSSSSVMKRSPAAAMDLHTPVSTTTAMDLEPLPTLQSLLSSAGEEHSPTHLSPEGLVNPLLNPSRPHEVVNPEIRLCESHLMSPRDQAATKACRAATGNSEQSPPAAVKLALGAAAAAATQAATAGKGQHSSTAKLPAKLRCKQGAGSSNRSTALLGQLGVGVGSPDSSSSREPSPAAAAAAAASPPVQSLADLADAAAAEAHGLQQRSKRGSSSSAAASSVADKAGAGADADAGGHLPAGSSGSQVSSVTPAGRMGLKRLWCNTHAAAMAAEAAATAVQGSTTGSTAGSTPHHTAGVRMGVRSWSPDSQAVAMSAELLLAAAELDQSAAAVQAVQAEAVPDQLAAAAVAAAATSKVVAGFAELQQQRQVVELPVHTEPEPAAPAALSFVPKHMKPRRYSQHHTAAEQQQQQQLCRRDSEHGSAAAAVAANSADVARDVTLPGDSLMLPPAAQLRLRQQQQQQHPAATAPAASTATAAATVGQPTWAVAIPSAACTVVASAAQLTSAVAATSRGLQCMPYVLVQPATMAAAAGQQNGAQRQQQQDLSSLPHALQQLNVQRLNQQLSAMGYTHNNSCNNPVNKSRNSSGGSSSSNGGTSTARIAHVTPALHAAQAGLTRTSHTGVLLQASLPGVPHNQTQQPRQQHTAAAAVWDQATAQALRQQQQQGRSAAVAATMVRGCTPEPPSMGAVDTAAAARTVSSQQQQVAPVSVELPCIKPLKVPVTLSDDEAWRLALADPQVMESEAARARELLAGVPFVAAAAAAPSSAAALAALPTVGRKEWQATAVQTLAGTGATAGSAPIVAAGAAAAATSCQGVQFRPSSGSNMQDVAKQQAGSSKGCCTFGVLRSANIINMQ